MRVQHTLDAARETEEGACKGACDVEHCATNFKCVAGSTLLSPGSGPERDMDWSLTALASRVTLASLYIFRAEAPSSPPLAGGRFSATPLTGRELPARRPCQDSPRDMDKRVVGWESVG